MLLTLSFENAQAEDNSTREVPSQYRSVDTSYPFFLFNENDYFRSNSEIYENQFNSEKISIDLSILQLKNFFLLEEHARLISQADTLLKSNNFENDLETQCEIGKWMTASLIKQQRMLEAENTWNSHCYQINKESFPEFEYFPEKKDPTTARVLSAIVPGSGFLYSGSYQKAVVSFLLNAVFIAGIVHYYSDQQYGIAGVLSYFELGWYFGGQNGAAEAIDNYNQKIKDDLQNTWIHNNLNF